MRAERVVLCTNGFLDHVLENLAGESLDHTVHHQLIGTKGYMTGVAEPGLRDPNAYSFIRNEHIGDDEMPYLYVTRRPWDDDADAGRCSAARRRSSTTPAPTTPTTASRRGSSTSSSPT